MAKISLIAGLGNPGPEYSKTRHNAGFMLLDKLAGSFGAEFKAWKTVGEYAKIDIKGRAVYLARPLTYMNLSGSMAVPLANYFKIPAAECLVCYDDLDLPLGAVRLRERGSSGGQKGMNDILEKFGTQQVPRLRLGIGPKPARMDAAAFVLAKFNAAEHEDFARALEVAEQCVITAVTEGMERAMRECPPK